MKKKNYFLVLFVTALICLTASVLATSHFVGSSLNASEMDFLIFAKILGNEYLFQNTVYPDLARNTVYFSILPTLARCLFDFGFSDDLTVVMFAFLQNIVVCSGIGYLFCLLFRRENPWLAPFAILFFIASSQHFLDSYKLITTTFVSGFSIAAIIFALIARYRSSAFFSFAVGVMHPVHYIVTTITVLSLYYGRNRVPSQSLLKLKSIKPIRLILIAAIAISFYWVYIKLGSSSGTFEYVEWKNILTNRSDLAFPVRQGLFLMLDYSIFFIVSAYIFHCQSRTGLKLLFSGLQSVALIPLPLLVIQAISSEYSDSVSLISLALSHRAMFTISIIVYAGLIGVVLFRFYRGSLAWLILLYFATVEHIFSDLPGIGYIHKSAFAFMILALQNIDNVNGNGRGFLFRCGALLLFLLLASLVKESLVLTVLAFVTVAYILERSFLGVGVLANLKVAVIRGAIPFLVVLLGFKVFYLDKNLTSHLAVWSSLDDGGKNVPNTRITKTALEHRDFVEFISNNVPADVGIIMIPFELSRRFNPAPYRTLFLDWHEMSYILYRPSFTSSVAARLSVYGLMNYELAASCGLSNMFLADPRSSNFRCQRRSFFERSQIHDSSWRSKISDINSLSPSVNYALMHRDFLCKGDIIWSVWKDFVLVALSNIAPEKHCKSGE